MSFHVCVIYFAFHTHMHAHTHTLDMNNVSVTGESMEKVFVLERLRKSYGAIMVLEGKTIVVHCWKKDTWNVSKFQRLFTGFRLFPLQHASVNITKYHFHFNRFLV